MNDPRRILDVIVIGGGPAGLSAALLLGRCRRDLLLFDEGLPRNMMSRTVHCFLGLPGSSPADLIETGRRQLAAYPNVNFQSGRVERTYREGGVFHVFPKDGAEFRSRALIVATGLIDELPRLEGIEILYGKSVFPCPYCDGWENSDRDLGVYGEGEDAALLAIELKLWSERVSLFTAGPLADDALAIRLARHNIKLRQGPMRRVAGHAGKLEAIVSASGEIFPCDALFLVPLQVQHHDFLETMGCHLNDAEQAECDESGRTGTPGLFVAGNAKRGLQLAMVAAADGLRCAAAANEWLLHQAEI